MVRKGYIKSVIDLPPNPFYGTVIHACIIVLMDTSQIELTIFTYPKVAYAQKVTVLYKQ